MRAAGIGAKLATTREPCNHHAGENAEHDFEHDHGDVIADTGAALFIRATAKHGLVDCITDHPRAEHHEGIEHALDQGQRLHVAVRDVTHLLDEPGFSPVPPPLVPPPPAP